MTIYTVEKRQEWDEIGEEEVDGGVPEEDERGDQRREDDDTGVQECEEVALCRLIYAA